MAFGGTVAIRAMKDGDFLATIFPGTTVGLQAAIDSLVGGRGKIMLGPGTIDLTAVIYVHGNCTIEGCGPDVTVLRRATGSLTSGDAQYTGCIFFATPFGSTSPPSSATFQTDITIRSLTLDGNYAAFGAVNPGTPRHMGIYFFFVAELRVYDCEIKNFLQNGIYLDACKNSALSRLRLTTNGQYASPSTKNSIDISNTQPGAIAAGFATNFTLDDIISSNPIDEHLDIANCNNVSVSNMICTGGDIVIELQGDTTRTSAMRGYTFVNVTATDNTGAFITNNVSAGVTLSDVTVANCYMAAHTTSHNRPAIVVSQGAVSVPVSRFVVENSIFSNINSSDTSNIPFVDISGSSATASTYLIFNSCVFVGGAPASVKTGGHGIQVKSNVSRLKLDACTFTTVPGVGVFINPGANQTISDSELRGVSVDTANNDGYQFVENASANGIIKNLIVQGCISRNAYRVTGSNGYLLGARSAAGGGSVSNIVVSGCLAYVTSGGGTGLLVDEGAGGTTSHISLYGNDFTNLGFIAYQFTGTPINIHFTPTPGRGTDIASQATISMPPDGDVFHVTGNTNITNGITVNPQDNGRTVRLIFDSTPTVSDTGTSRLNGNFVATSDDTLTIVCDGTNWFELGRSQN